jgi:hypothetical protein
MILLGHAFCFLTTTNLLPFVGFEFNHCCEYYGFLEKERLSMVITIKF